MTKGLWTRSAPAGEDRREGGAEALGNGRRPGRRDDLLRARPRRCLSPPRPARRRRLRRQRLLTGAGRRSMNASQRVGSVSGARMAVPASIFSVAGEIDRLSDHLRPLGRGRVPARRQLRARHDGRRPARIACAGGVPHTIERFNGECCSEEIARVELLARARSAAVSSELAAARRSTPAKVVACAIGARLASSRPSPRPTRRAAHRRALHAERCLSGGDLASAQSRCRRGRQRRRREGARCFPDRGRRTMHSQPGSKRAPTWKPARTTTSLRLSDARRRFGAGESLLRRSHA